MKQQAEQIVEKVKALVKDGSASRVMLKRKGETILNLSLNMGILGAAIGLAASPFALLTAALVSFGLDCEIEVEKKDGSIVNLNRTPVGEKLGSLKDSAKEKAKGFFEKSKGPYDVDYEPVDDPADDFPDVPTDDPADAPQDMPADDPDVPEE